MTTETKPLVVITGAAGGLGQGLVESFHAAGWDIAAAWHKTPLPETSKHTLAVQIDATVALTVKDAFEKVFKRFGRLDCVVHAAGCAQDDLLLKMEEAAWDEVLDTNLKSSFLICREAVSRTARTGGTHLILIGSFAGRAGSAGQANYAAAKAGLSGLATSIAKEYGRRNMRVNVVLPGVVVTAMTQNLAPEVLQGYAQANALQRINDVGEVAHFITHLAGMRNVSGQVFQLDSRVGRWG